MRCNWCKNNKNNRGRVSERNTFVCRPPYDKCCVCGSQCRTHNEFINSEPANTDENESISPFSIGFCTYGKRQPPNEVRNDVNVRREQTFIILFARRTVIWPNATGQSLPFIQRNDNTKCCCEECVLISVIYSRQLSAGASDCQWFSLLINECWLRTISRTFMDKDQQLNCVLLAVVTNEGSQRFTGQLILHFWMHSLTHSLALSLSHSLSLLAEANWIFQFPVVTGISQNWKRRIYSEINPRNHCHIEMDFLRFVRFSVY